MMQNSESTEQAEALVDTLHIDGTISEANLTGLSTSDLEQLADLEAELQCINDPNVEGTEGIEIKQILHEDIVETEIGEQEIEIETEDIEQPGSPDEILPDYKEHSLKYDDESGTPPPLRPLSIAPKPSGIKVPMSVKNTVVNTGTGQQFFLIQSPGGSTNAINIAGQPIKLVSAQGQQLSLPNIQNVSLANKQGIVRLQSVNKTGVSTQGTDSTVATQAQIKSVIGAAKKNVPQNKNIVAKVILGGQQGQVVLTSQPSETQPQQIKLVTSGMAPCTLGTTAKTITLAQAQQLGLITSNKVQQILPQQTSKQIVVNKPIQAKTIKVIPQGKSPTKILPAPVQSQKNQSGKGTTQRVIIRQGGQLKTGTVVTSGMNQIIRIPGSQGINPGQLHQINVPGKGVQYVRFMTATTTTSSTTTTTPKSVTQTSSAQKAQVVPVGNVATGRSGSANKVNASVTASASQNVIKVMPMSASQTRPVAPKPVPVGQRLLIPATTAQSRPTPATIATIPASALSQLQGALIPSGNNVSQIVMLPAQYIQQIQNQTGSAVSPPTPKVAVSAKSLPQKTLMKVSPNQAKENISTSSDSFGTSPESTNYSRTIEPNGIRPRKPCNCAKSLCLKLYCDCFANGEFCHLCNCMNCYNNLGKEEERQRAIRNCLERNPNAFRPKIGKGRDAGESSVRKHTKGCNCKRSGCLKNYCECYEAKIACSNNCKCIGCRNIEDSMEKKNLRPLIPIPESTGIQVVPTIKSVKMSVQDIISFRPLMSNPNTKVPSNYMTNDVIEATNQCMMAHAYEAERNMMTEELAKKLILEEFGRCLVQIIECSTNASSGNT